MCLKCGGSGERLAWVGCGSTDWLKVRCECAILNELRECVLADKSDRRALALKTEEGG